MKLVLAFAVIASPAIAQQPTCAPFQEAQEHLAREYGEQVMFVGLGQSGALMVVFLNAETGTWTAAVIGPDQMACMIADGEAGQYLPPHAEGVDG